jgi:hypothetical protein
VFQRNLIFQIERRKYTREFKLETVNMMKGKGVSWQLAGKRYIFLGKLVMCAVLLCLRPALRIIKRCPLT